MMKKSGGAFIFVKQVVSVLSSITKSKSIAIKNKAEALKARLVMCSLLRNKRLPLAAVISRKVHAILGAVGSHEQQHDDHDCTSASCDEEGCKCKANQSHPSASCGDEQIMEELGVDDDYYNSYYYFYYYNNRNDDDKYPDLRHGLFDHEYLENHDQLQGAGGGDEDPNASVIDMVKNSKEQEGEDFRLEDEIDHVADLFITKFHKRMKLQKLESFKRYQDMLARGAA